MIDPGAPQFEIVLGATALTELTLRYVISIELHEAMDEMDMLVLRLALPEAESELDQVLQIGQMFTATLSYGVTAVRQVAGYVVEVSHRYSAREGRTATIRGLDSLFKLKQKKLTRHWNMAHSEIASLIATEHGLTPLVEGVMATATHEFQENISNASFLKRLASQHNYYVGAKETQLIFGRMTPTVSTPVVLDRCGSLLDFQVTRSLEDLPTQVIVRGWDYRLNRAVTGTSTATMLQRYSGGPLGVELAQTNLGPTTLEIDNAALSSESACLAYATATHQAKADRFVQGIATAVGTPDLVSGGKVMIAGVGAQSGTYLVRATTHMLEPATGYRTRLKLCSDSLCTAGGAA